MFAPLALTYVPFQVTVIPNKLIIPSLFRIANTTISIKGPAGSSRHKSIVGPVAGGVIGGLAFVALVVLVVFFWRRKNRSQRKDVSVDFLEDSELEGHHPIFNAYMPVANTSEVGPTGLVTLTATSLSPIPQTPQIMPLSSKAREAMENQPVQTLYDPPTSSYPASSSGSSQEPSDVIPTDEVRGLRQEMEILRRAVQDIQPPPTYDG